MRFSHLWRGTNMGVRGLGLEHRGGQCRDGRQLAQQASIQGPARKLLTGRGLARGSRSSAP
jgi:hypothetical protein